MSIEPRCFLTVVAAALLSAAPIAAQQGGDGLTGTRVRVTAPHFLPAPLTGTVTSYTRDGLGVRGEASGDTASRAAVS